MCGFCVWLLASGAQAIIWVRVVEATLHQVAPVSEITLPPLKVYTFYPVSGSIISRTMMPNTPGSGAEAQRAAGDAAPSKAVGAAGASGSGSSTGSVPPVVDAAKGKVKKGGKKRDAPGDEDEDGDDDEDDIGDDGEDELEDNEDGEFAKLAQLEKKTKKKGRPVTPKKKAKAKA
jgi:hypothetical protein